MYIFKSCAAIWQDFQHPKIRCWHTQLNVCEKEEFQCFLYLIQIFDNNHFGWKLFSFCEFAQLIKQLFLSQLEINQVIQQPKTRRHVDHLDGEGYIWQSNAGYIKMRLSGRRIPFFIHIKVRPTEKLPPAESPPTRINLPLVPKAGKFWSIQL